MKLVLARNLRHFNDYVKKLQKSGVDEKVKYVYSGYDLYGVDPEEAEFVVLNGWTEGRDPQMAQAIFNQMEMLIELREIREEQPEEEERS